MPPLFALAASVGVLAVVATWLFGLDPLTAANLQVWQAFIAWGCHYHSGAGVGGTRTTIVCMSFGALVGMVSVMLAGAVGAPIAVGIGATVIVLASKLPLLATIPASVYGFASIAGLILLGPGTEPGLAPAQAIIPTILSILIGAAFGFVSEKVADALTSKSAVSDKTASRVD